MIRGELIFSFVLCFDLKISPGLRHRGKPLANLHHSFGYLSAGRLWKSQESNLRPTPSFLPPWLLYLLSYFPVYHYTVLATEYKKPMRITIWVIATFSPSFAL